MEGKVQPVIATAPAVGEVASPAVTAGAGAGTGRGPAVVEAGVGSQRVDLSSAGHRSTC
jgi:hypothetical protein